MSSPFRFRHLRIGSPWGSSRRQDRLERMGPERSLARLAFAKINLDLRVLGIRPDGYHELRTTFQSIALADRLTFEQTRGPFRIECDDPACPTDRRNLIWKAADMVSKHRKRRPSPSGVTVRVEKNIPM